MQKENKKLINEISSKIKDFEDLRNKYKLLKNKTGEVQAKDSEKVNEKLKLKIKESNQELKNLQEKYSKMKKKK